MNRVALILPWNGKHPWYWDLWKRSTVGRRFDVIVVEKSLSEFSSLVNQKLLARFGAQGETLDLLSSYKLCDLRPMFGILFDDLVADYDYWAFGDCDVIYGRKIDDWIAKVLDGGYDIATIQSEFLSGPFTLVRNCDKCNTLFLKTSNWQAVLQKRIAMYFDELGENWFRRHIFGKKSYEELRKSQESFSALCWREAANGTLKLLHEQVIDERNLGKKRAILQEDGRLMIATEELSLFHFISCKYDFGFTGDDRSVWLSRGIPWFRDAVRFFLGFVSGNRAARTRVIECIQRRLGMDTWDTKPAWNNLPW